MKKAKTNTMTEATHRILASLNGELERKLREHFREILESSDKSDESYSGKPMLQVDEVIVVKEKKANSASLDLSTAEFINNMEIDILKVSIGTVVELLYIEEGTTEKTAILGYWDAYLFEEGKYPELFENIDFVMSLEAPIAKAIMGKKPDTKVTVKVPDGYIDIKIISISKFEFPEAEAVEELIQKLQKQKGLSKK